LFENSGNEGGQRFTVRLTEYFIATLTWLIIPISLALALFFDKRREDDTWVKDKTWIAKMTEEGCTGVFEGVEYLHHRHFLHTSIIAAAFGSIVG
jgi:hypothetical protein